MKPTPELRYLKQKVYVGCGGWEWQLALQQKWEPELTDAYNAVPEWRFVPIVKDTEDERLPSNSR